MLPVRPADSPGWAQDNGILHPYPLLMKHKQSTYFGTCYLPVVICFYTESVWFKTKTNLFLAARSTDESGQSLVYRQQCGGVLWWRRILKNSVSVGLWSSQITSHTINVTLFESVVHVCNNCSNRCLHELTQDDHHRWHFVIHPLAEPNLNLAGT